MKKWKEYSALERRMIVVIVVLLLAILFSWQRVENNFKKGCSAFFGNPADTTVVYK